MAKPRMSLKARALKYLSMREHSRLELARKLQHHVEEGDDVEALLNTLEQAKFLSEERFTEALVHRRAARFGNSRIFAELQTHGVESDALNCLRQSLAQDEPKRAWEVLRKKFDHVPRDATERAKQIRFLQQRGFSLSAIQTAIRQLSLPSEENI